MSFLDAIPPLSAFSLDNRRVLLRVDLNVPYDNGRILDDTRIRESLPTLEFVRSQGGKVILLSHLGRPPRDAQGECSSAVREQFSLAPCGERLAELLGCEVVLPEDCLGDAATKVVHDLRPGQVCLLENLRFHAGEETNDLSFARELARLGDVYLNDAFSVSHRKHASVYALPKLFQERGAGLLLQKEMESLLKLHAPERPYVAVLGGGKVADKIELIEALLPQIDTLLVGGAMANTFLAAQGLELQSSRVERDKLPLARALLQKAAAQHVEVLLPVDVLVADSPSASHGACVPVEAFPVDSMALDIGFITRELFCARIQAARTVFWNGPMGVFEKAPFAGGSIALAEALAASSGFSLVGGGDTLAALQGAGADVVSQISHLSTGGGALLEWMVHHTLPGVEALLGGGAR